MSSGTGRANAVASLVLLAAVFLIPGQRPLGVGLPVMPIGLVGLLSLGYLTRQWRHLNPGARLPGRWLVYFAGMTAAYAGVAAVGAALLTGRTEALYALVACAAVLLATATVGPWILLTHAG